MREQSFSVISSALSDHVHVCAAPVDYEELDESSGAHDSRDAADVLANFAKLGVFPLFCIALHLYRVLCMVVGMHMSSWRSL